MKKIFCLYVGNQIVFVSTNLKACHKCMLHHITKFDMEHMIGYSQITRMIKKYGFYKIDTQFGGTYVLYQYPVYIRFSTELFGKSKIKP